MRIIGLLITTVLAVQFCGCDGEMWISTGDDGWTSDFDQPWPPANSAASAEGTASTNSTKKTGTSKTVKTKTDSTPKKTENLELALGVPAQAKPGEKFSVSLTVKNSTGEELKNVVVQGMVPAGLKVTDASGQVSMRWKLKSLAAGESKSLSATLKATSQGSYILQASVTADGGKIASTSADVKVNAEQQTE